MRISVGHGAEQAAFAKSITADERETSERCAGARVTCEHGWPEYPSE